MSLADREFIAMCTDILEHGTSTEGQKVRPHWEDGTPAYTIMKFCEVNRFDLSREFPALTLRKVAIKSATDELLWIWQQKSNNVHDLHSHIWDAWADENGTIGKAYGYQMGQKHRCTDVSEEGLRHAFPDYIFTQEKGKRQLVSPYQWPVPEKEADAAAEDVSAQSGSAGAEDAGRLSCAEKMQEAGHRVCAVLGSDGIWQMDQVDKVIYDLKNAPFGRRILTTLWNPEDLADMALQPCAYNCTFVVTQQKGQQRLTLNMILNQRSQDILAAWAWNTAQYAVLLEMMAQVCDMQPGEFVHIDANAHIYDRHIGIIRELISRKPQPAPRFWLNPDIHDFYLFTRNDVALEDYKVAGEQIKNIPVAV